MSQNGYCAIFPALISIGPNKLRGGGGGSEKNKKINNRPNPRPTPLPPRLLGT